MKFIRLLSPECGSALVETALTLPLLFVMMLGAVELARVACAAIEISNAAKAAVAYGAQNFGTDTDAAGMQLAATNEVDNITGLTFTSTNVQFSLSGVCSSGVPCTGPDNGSGPICTSTDCGTGDHPYGLDVGQHRSADSSARLTDHVHGVRRRGPNRSATVTGGEMRNFFRCLRDESGNSVVEMAVSSVLFFAVLFGVFQVSLASYTYHPVSEVAREASRWAIVRGSNCHENTPGQESLRSGPGGNFGLRQEPEFPGNRLCKPDDGDHRMVQSWRYNALHNGMQPAGQCGAGDGELHVPIFCAVRAQFDDQNRQFLAHGYLTIDLQFTRAGCSPGERTGPPALERSPHHVRYVHGKRNSCVDPKDAATMTSCGWGEITASGLRSFERNSTEAFLA